MRGKNKTKPVVIQPPDTFNFKSSENINERHVFEKLCLDTSLRGFSYDPTLLVDLDKVSSFDEACIRLTTKCGSIVTQLSSVGHNVTDFAVTAAVTATGTLTSPKTPTVPKIAESPVSLFSSQMSPSSLYFLDSQTSPLSPTSLAKPKFHGFDCMKNDTLTPQDNRNITVMSQLWGGLKKKNYTGMVAVARVTSTSLPNNSFKDRYSTKALTDTLLSNIKAYFMFQKFASTFDKDFVNTGASYHTGKNNNNELGREYLLYVVYRSKAADKDTKNEASLKQRSTEADKLSSPWSAYVSGSSRKLRHESGDSAVSSCSSISSTTSGGPSSFSIPSGKTSNIRLENPQSYSSPQVLRSPASQTRKLITPPSPPSPATPKVSPLQGVQGQKSQAQNFSKTPTFSLRNLRNHPYKPQQANSSSNIEPFDTVSKAINVAISSISPKTQPQSIFTNQVKHQQKTPIKKQTLPQIDKKLDQQNKTPIQMQRQQPTRLQQQKSQEITTKGSIISLTAKNSCTPKRVPITAPKPEGPTKNLRSHSSTISSLPKILRSTPAAPVASAAPVAPVAPAALAPPTTPAAPAAISQRNLRNSFTRK